MRSLVKSYHIQLSLGTLMHGRDFISLSRLYSIWEQTATRPRNAVSLGTGHVLVQVNKGRDFQIVGAVVLPAAVVFT